jgi:hypothetical protein
VQSAKGRCHRSWVAPVPYNFSPVYGEVKQPPYPTPMERSPPAISEISSLPVARHSCPASYPYPLSPHPCPRSRPRAKLSSALAQGSTHPRYIQPRSNRQLQRREKDSATGEKNLILTFCRSCTQPKVAGSCPVPCCAAVVLPGIEGGVAAEARRHCFFFLSSFSF